MKRSSPIDYNTIFSPATVLKSFGSAVDGTLPLDGSGLRAMVVRVTATAAGFVRMSSSQAPVTATKNDTLIQPGDFLLMRTAGMDYVSFISDSASATCTISPQEWGGYVTGTVVVQFSPAMLFTGTTTGAWYDPSDLNTLFQDAAGTTPVTAVEQPAGLMLDKSKGLVLGPELVTNGDFSNGTTGWTLVNTTVSASQLVFSGAVGATATQSGVFLSGKNYKFTVDVSRTAGTLYILAGGNVVLTRTASGTVSFIANNVSAGSLQLLSNDFSGSIDNISVRELPGNHAFNSSGNSANFPVLSARYNLLTKTEQFDDAAWSKAGAVVASNTVTAPDGTNTADTLSTGGAPVSQAYQIGLSISSGSTYIGSCYLKAGATSFGVINLYDSSVGNKRVWFNLSTGSVGTQDSGITGTIAPVGNGWYRCAVSRVSSSASGGLSVELSAADGSTTSSNGNSIYIWGADLRVANDALNQPAYQRVNTATDYDTVGFKPYLKFNGTNQWLQTNSIDFSYGDKMFVSAGVRKLTSGVQVALELSTNVDVNNNAFNIASDAVSANNWYTSSGSISQGQIHARATTYQAPITNTLALRVDRSITGNSQLAMNVNGATQSMQYVGTGSTGNYGSYPLYIGARAGSSLWFNGRLYGMVVAGKQASAAEITSTETYINQKTGAY